MTTQIPRISPSNVKPDYLGIQWPKEQTMPTPIFEITPGEYRSYLVFLGTPHAVMHDQCYLDYGKGPLMQNPRTIQRNVRADTPVDTVVKIGYWARDHFKMPTQTGLFKGMMPDSNSGFAKVEVNGVLYENVTGLELSYPALYYGVGGWENANFWTVNYQWWPNMGLAYASNYISLSNYNRDFQANERGLDAAHITGLGEFQPDQRGGGGGRLFPNNPYGWALRYFRVGCDHPNLHEIGQKRLNEIRQERGEQLTYLFNMMHADYCPDCGYLTVYDSSG